MAPGTMLVYYSSTYHSYSDIRDALEGTTLKIFEKIRDRNSEAI